MKPIPDDWTRYLGVDPGHTAQAALMIAVPPPEHPVGDIVLVYDEVFLQRKTCDEFASTIAQRVSRQVFQAFVMDSHAGRQTPYGQAGRTIKQQYADAFNRYGLRSIDTGSSFLDGSDDVSGRAMILRDWMAKRPDGSTKLRVLRDRCPTLEEQIRRFKKRVVKDETQDKPIAKDCDCVVVLEYLAAMNPAWHPRDYGAAPLSPAYRAVQYFRALSRQKMGPEHIDFGSPLTPAA